MNAESVIQGVGSAKFEPATVIGGDFKPEIVFVAYGTNDYHTFKTLAEVEQRAETFMKNVKTVYADAKIFVLSPTYRTDGNVQYPVGPFENFCNRLKDIAKDLDLNVIDGEKLLPPHEYFMADSLHPNDLGFSVFALNLLRMIKDKI